MPSPDVAKLVPAVLSLVRDARGFATKTKLLKYLYLIDVEHYRRFGETATGFRWVFHKYGPWSRDYDPLLEQMSKEGIVRITSGTRDNLDTQFVDPATSPAKLDVLGWSFDLQLTVKRIIEAWADRPTGEILDYAYFHTEPMHDARRGQELDFAKIERTHQTKFYFRSRSFKNEEELSKARKQLRKLFKRRRQHAKPQAKITPPKYDAEFWKAIHVLRESPE